LLPIHGIKLDAEFCPAVIGLAATVARHASHAPRSFFVAPKDSAVRVRRLSTMIQRGYALRHTFAKKLCV
jgi:hypothetical protein